MKSCVTKTKLWMYDDWYDAEELQDEPPDRWERALPMLRVKAVVESVHICRLHNDPEPHGYYMGRYAVITKDPRGSITPVRPLCRLRLPLPKANPWMKQRDSA